MVVTLQMAQVRHLIEARLVGVLLNAATTWSVVWATATADGTSAKHWYDALVYVFFYSLFAANAAVDATRPGQYHQTDWFYNVLSVSSKVSLFWLHAGESARARGDGAWAEVQVFVLGGALPCAVLVAGIVLRPRGVPHMRKRKVHAHDCIGGA